MSLPDLIPKKRGGEPSPPPINLLIETMDIQLKTHIVQDRTVSVDESDLAELFGAVRQVFLHFIQYHDFHAKNCGHPVQEKLNQLCEKYGVNPEIEEDRVSFFESMLGGK